MPAVFRHEVVGAGTVPVSGGYVEPAGSPLSLAQSYGTLLST